MSFEGLKLNFESKEFNTIFKGNTITVVLSWIILEYEDSEYSEDSTNLVIEYRDKPNSLKVFTSEEEKELIEFLKQNGVEL